MRKLICGLSVCFTLLAGCGDSGDEKNLFSLQQHTGIRFRNEVSNSPDFNIFSYRNFYNGGGVAIGDINNDGLADVFFTANMGSNKLFLNKGNWQFDDISAKAGFVDKKDWSTGVVMVDINQDGWLDIFVCNAGYINGAKPRCQLFINNKDLSFTDKAEEYGLTNEGGYTTHAAFFDYDADGDLDCFIINNSFIPVNTLNYANKRNLRAADWPVADFLKGGGDHLLRNDDGKFTDVSKEAGIYGSLVSFGLGVTVGDLNGDHCPDVYVSNDFFERDYLYINQRDGTFKDELEQWVQHVSHSSMGADMADVNNDGYPDIFTTDMLPDDDYRLKTTTTFDNIDVHRLKQKSGFYNQYTQNTLQINNRNGKFMETGFYSGVAASDWSWGGLIFDADNDGRSDIFVCNGIYHDVTDQDFIDFFANDIIQRMVMTGEKDKFDEIVNKMPSRPVPNKLFLNQGDLRFADPGNKSGLGTPSFSNGSAYGDLDNDGDLDLVVNNMNMDAFVYRNNSREINQHHYIGIQLKDTGRNTFAVGSKIQVYQGTQVFSREVIPSRGFQSSVDYRQIIGLGTGVADSMLITWPDGSSSRIILPEIDKVHVITAASTAKHRLTAPVASQPFFALTDLPVFDKHTEDDFIDFYNERNIPVMLSREGPHADTADVNGDGLSDLYIGGAAGQPGQLYLQTATGSFLKTASPAFEADKAFEEVAVLFFDADKDGDKDLFIGAGGNAQQPDSRLLAHRLYLNDGKGNFTNSPVKLPANTMNIAVAVAHDVDRDGDQDLFIGARSVPMQYGTVPDSYLWINNGSGEFTAAPPVKAGMITDAVFADLTGDAQAELLLVGEWMSPRLYTIQNQQLTEAKTDLSSLKGWWQSVAVADLDGDKRMDIILGNTGENFYLKPTPEQPVRLWISDFDENGTADRIITRTVNKKDMPVFLKRDLTDQLPVLKKQNLKFEAYGNKTIQQLFPGEVMQKAQMYEFNSGASCIAYNEGDGRFLVQPLPVQVQFSSVNAIVCHDFNQDGRPDLVMGGNQFHFQPQFSRLDASYGHFIINKGRSQWEWVAPRQSGLELRGMVRDIRLLPITGRTGLLFLQNDESPVFYTFSGAIK